MVQTDWRDIVRRIANRLDEAVESAASARGMLEVAGQQAAGRLFDGREWDEYPEVDQ